jgi:hypothetical protein
VFAARERPFLFFQRWHEFRQGDPEAARQFFERADGRGLYPPRLNLLYGASTKPRAPCYVLKREILLRPYILHLLHVSPINRLQTAGTAKRPLARLFARRLARTSYVFYRARVVTESCTVCTLHVARPLFMALQNPSLEGRQSPM